MAFMRGGERRQLDDVACRRRAPVGRKWRDRAGIGAQQLDAQRPVVRDPRRDRETVFGEADRRRERAVEPEAAVRVENRSSQASTAPGTVTAWIELMPMVSMPRSPAAFGRCAAAPARPEPL